MSEGYVYLLRLEDTNYFKVGITSDINARISTLQTGTPMAVVLVESYWQATPGQIERDIHYVLRDLRVRGEWFKADPDDIQCIFRAYNTMAIVDIHFGVTLEEPSTEDRHILDLFDHGKTIGEIVKAIHGDVTGPRYTRVRNDVEAVIRCHWRGPAKGTS